MFPLQGGEQLKFLYIIVFSDERIRVLHINNVFRIFTL